jgi:hypothetical protein
MTIDSDEKEALQSDLGQTGPVHSAADIPAFTAGNLD